MREHPILKAARGERTDYTPIWIMRQAGRYSERYRRIREKAGSFMELCRNPKLAAEVTLIPVDEIGVDAAILFSDILVPVEKMGVDVKFVEGKGPVLSKVETLDDVERLRVPEPERELPYVLETIRIVKERLDRPLIGFSGAPFTLATYMIEGGGSKNFINTKTLMYREPGAFHALMKKITGTTIAYLTSQVKAGVQAVQVFDSWAGVLAPDDYRVYSLPYVKETIRALRPLGVPVIYFVNNCGGLLEQARTSGADVIGIDWRVDMGKAIKRLGSNISVQGNLDPCTLFSSEDVLRSKAEDILKKARAARGHVFNLGHGILPQTSPDMAKALVDIVHELSEK